MRIQSRLRDDVAPRLELLDIFRFPTVATLAAHIAQPLASQRAAALQPHGRNSSVQLARKDLRRQHRLRPRGEELT